MNLRFYQLAIGALFEFRGKRYKKTAMSAADTDETWGIFLGETEVVSEGPLLPPDVAAKWKPERGHWTAVIESLVAGRFDEGDELGGA